MDPRELHDFALEVALELPHSRLTFPFGEEWEVFKVGERMFLLLTDTNGPQMVTMKVDPQEGRALVEAYDDVIPGYHLNKRHWVTVFSPVEEPEASSAPETSSMPEDSNPPESPKALEASSLPETSGAPDASDTPNAPQTPDAPHSPARSSRRIGAEELRELIISSYLLVIAKMPKKDRPIDPYAYGEIHDQKRDQHRKRDQRLT